MANFKKMLTPSLFLIYFCLFKQNLQFLKQIFVKKSQSRMRCWDLNPQPSTHESPPITTRPGLPLYANDPGSNPTEVYCLILYFRGC